MTKKAREKLRRSRAAEQAENYAINKYIRQLEASLKAQDTQIKELQTELTKVKQELKSTSSKLRREKASHKETKAQLSSITTSARNTLSKLGVKNLNNKSISETFKKLEQLATTSGPFDSYGYSKGWEYSAQKAGNRLEKAHPGFFQAMKMVEANGGNVLDLLINYYGVKWHKSEIYADDSSATIDEDYQLLGRVCYEQYNVVIPGYEG